MQPHDSVSHDERPGGRVAATAQPARALRVERLGQVAYGPALALQELRHREVAGGACDTLFLLEHPPVVTTGRNTGSGHVLLPQALLAARGVAYFETGRGGDVTYHAPGQLVGYPIVQLQEGERDVRSFVHRLEEVLVRTAADFGVAAQRVEGLRGIWVGDSKLAAIGVRIARWTTMHGFALNVSTDLSGFDCIVPCGLHGKGVTSLARCLGRAPAMAEVQARVIFHTASVLGRRAETAEATPPPSDWQACLAAPSSAAPSSNSPAARPASPPSAAAREGL